ncbi:hypothetical protein HCN44_004232 [Aphidius gifuensis]|uniref:Cytochrome P450 n=1 Tax=Aphidius gifuensis TaxID=684658 RepID=A0A835CVU4_APHGI|nr:hypothetical protein HCN44_004232 [Aphidius gifuensis]
MAVITKYLSVDVILVLASFVILSYLYMTRKFKFWKKLGVMEQSPTPFIGNIGEMMMMKKSPGQWLQDLYNWSSGLPYMGFYVFDRPFFLVRDPDLIKNILVRDSHIFQNRFVSASSDDPLGSVNLFLAKNPIWKLIRQKLTPIYTSGRLKKMFELMKEVGHDFDKHLESLGLEGEGKNIEFKEISAKFTTDMIATTAFGLRANSLNDPDAEFRKEGKRIFSSGIYRNFELTSLFFLPQLLKPLGLRFIPKDSTKFLRSVIMSTIDEREKSGCQRGDLIDLLVDLRRNQVDGPEKELFRFDGDNLVAQATVFFTGGFETSSSVLSMALGELAIHPEIQTKLRNEILEYLDRNKGQVTYDMTNAMPYLDMVVKETLRKYPPLPILDREALDDYKIPNYNLTLPKGTPVYISLYGLHYDPEYFPEPQKFIPERFTPEAKEERRNGVYLPFGDGPHVCIGLRIGLMQSKLGLINLLSKYEVSPCEETQIPMRFNPRCLITTAESGITLNIRKLFTIFFTMAYILIILLLTLIFLSYIYMKRNFSYWKKKGVTFVSPWPLFGNLFDLITSKKSAGQFFDDIYNNSSDQPYVGFFGLDKPMLVIRDPEIIKNVLVKDFNFFNDRFSAAGQNDHLGYSNLFLLKNPKWKYVRSKLTPIYTSSRLKLMFERMLIVALDFDTYLESLDLKDKGKSIELKEVCAKFTTDMIAMTGYGLRANSLNNPNAEFRKNGEKIFKPTFYRSIEWNTRTFAPHLMGLFGFTFFTKEASAFLSDALWSTIIQREQSGQKRNDLVDLLIELKNNDVNNPDKKIFGFETSSSLFAFTLYELAINPDIQSRLRNDINNALKKTNGIITYDMVTTLPYLDMIVHETLRKYPPLPFLDRIAADDYKVPGTNLIIEKGMGVFIPLTAIHSDPQYHENPDKFDPERFSEKNKESIKYSYYPFGDGPRNCIGMRLGLIQSKLGLIKVISKYEFTPCKDTLIPMEFSTKGLFSTPKTGIYLNTRKL